MKDAYLVAALGLQVCPRLPPRPSPRLPPRLVGFSDVIVVGVSDVIVVGVSDVIVVGFSDVIVVGLVLDLGYISAVPGWLRRGGYEVLLGGTKGYEGGYEGEGVTIRRYEGLRRGVRGGGGYY